MNPKDCLIRSLFTIVENQFGHWWIYPYEYDSKSDRTSHLSIFYIHHAGGNNRLVLFTGCWLSLSADLCLTAYHWTVLWAMTIHYLRYSYLGFSCTGYYLSSSSVINFFDQHRSFAICGSKFCYILSPRVQVWHSRHVHHSAWWSPHLTSANGWNWFWRFSLFYPKIYRN